MCFILTAPGSDWEIKIKRNSLPEASSFPRGRDADSGRGDVRGGRSAAPAGTGTARAGTGAGAPAAGGRAGGFPGVAEAPGGSAGGSAPARVRAVAYLPCFVMIISVWCR